MINQNDEQWRMIDGYGNYSVSSFGRVKNTTTSRILKPGRDTDGYYKINLSKNSHKKGHRIHRLVAFAFCNNDGEFDVVDHIDRNKLNNHYLNLRWTTTFVNNRNRPIQHNNTTGHRGVSHDQQNNSWLARWTDDERKQCQKTYSIKKYGEQAKQHAINKRLEMEMLFGYL